MSQLKKGSNEAIAAEYDTPQATDMHTTADDAGPARKPGKAVPHYLSKTIYQQDRTFRWLFAFSVLFSVAYFAVRVVYIVTGRVKVGMTADASPEQIRNVNRQNNSAIIYSSIVLVAEFGGFLLTHLGQQMFTRQRTRFGKMTDTNVERMKQVCPHPQPVLPPPPPATPRANGVGRLCVYTRFLLPHTPDPAQATAPSASPRLACLQSSPPLLPFMTARQQAGAPAYA